MKFRGSLLRTQWPTAGQYPEPNEFMQTENKNNDIKNSFHKETQHAHQTVPCVPQVN